MLEKVLVFSLGLAVGGPVMSYFVSHPTAQPATRYVTIIRRVPMVVHERPLYQLASYGTPDTVSVAGAEIEQVALASPPPSPLAKPELPERDATELKLLKCVTPKMLALWNQIEEQFGRLKIICTCDHSYYVAGTHRVSWHVSGNAIDFLDGGKRYTILAWLARHHTTGLTMTYEGSNHIHVDVGGYVHMALAARDRGLRVPGADAPARYTHARHSRQVQYEADDDDSSSQ